MKSWKNCANISFTGNAEQPENIFLLNKTALNMVFIEFVKAAKTPASGFPSMLSVFRAPISLHQRPTQVFLPLRFILWSLELKMFIVHSPPFSSSVSKLKIKTLNFKEKSSSRETIPMGTFLSFDSFENQTRQTKLNETDLEQSSFCNRQEE